MVFAILSHKSAPKELENPYHAYHPKITRIIRQKQCNTTLVSADCTNYFIVYI